MTQTTTKYLAFTALALASSVVAHATVSSTNHDNEIKSIIQKLNTNHGNTISRLQQASAYFLGRPYVLGPLGEGQQGRYDKHPLYRTDVFDCTTYVETVLALANAKNLTQFKNQMNHIRYKDGKISYLMRNHFMTTDWNKHNSENGYITDITYRFTNQKGQPIAKVAQATIDKPQWLKSAKLNSIIDTQSSNKQRQQRLAELKSLASKVQAEQGVILYLPLKALFDAKGKPKPYIFKQIPNGAIIEIVRPNWDIKDKAGTNLNVSHLGFAIWTPDGLMFREASQVEKKVIDIPLAQYLKEYINSPTVKGINVQQVR